MPLVEQMLAFLWTVAIGMFVGLCYEVYKVIIDILRLKKLGIFTGDLFFWLFLTAVAFYMLLHANYGQLRLYVFIGFLTGAFFYSRFLGDYTRKIVRWVFYSMGRIFRILALALNYIGKAVTFPFRIVFVTFIFPLRLFGKGLAYVGRLAGQPTRALQSKINFFKSVFMEKLKFYR